MRMTSLIIIICGLTMISNGCSTSTPIVEDDLSKGCSFEELNKIIYGNDVTIELKSGETYHGKIILISPDSTIWLDPAIEARSTLSNRAINKFIVWNHTRGAIDGLAVGVFGGAFIYWLALKEGAWLGSDGVPGVVILSALGVVAGGGIGHKYEYHFPEVSNE